jgi:hypothetical protein
MSARTFSSEVGAAVMTAFVAMAFGPPTMANEDDAKKLMKSMSDYMADQKSISLDFDSSLEVVTHDHQKLAFANSGKVKMVRPDKLHVTRKGGFSDAELTFDGNNVSLLDKEDKLFAKAEIPGSIDKLVEELREKYHRILPGADLLSGNIYEALMPEVTNVKDLGSGVIRGVEADHLAFRTGEVDWQIWIAQGDRPYPLRYIISSPNLPSSPQYQLDILNFRTGDQWPDSEFSLRPNGAKVTQPSELKNFDELPERYQPQR